MVERSLDQGLGASECRGVKAAHGERLSRSRSLGISQAHPWTQRGKETSSRLSQGKPGNTGHQESAYGMGKDTCKWYD